MLTRKSGSYFVYILLCNDGSYYTGYSSNPTGRLIKHLKGQGARYTRTHKPRGIVHIQRFKTRGAAMKRERAIKGLTHLEKRNLIEKASTTTNRETSRKSRISAENTLQ
jgi:putative endonuclease